MSRNVLARTLNRTIVVLLVGFVAACQTRPLPEGPDPSKALADLQRADSMIQAAIAARDAERTASFYAESAVLMPVAEPAVEGRGAIRATLVAAEPSIAGDLGYTRGTYESPMSGPDGQPLLERGKWVSVWKRQDDGQWRIIVDIFNTDSPPPVHASSTAVPSRQKP